MNNTTTIKSYNNNIKCYVLNFGEQPIIINKNSSIDDIYTTLECFIPGLIRTVVDFTVNRLDSESKNDFRSSWSTASKDEKIKEFFMFFLEQTLKVYQFSTNSIKCEIVFNSFCNEAVGYFKKNFSFYENMINQAIAA